MKKFLVLFSLLLICLMTPVTTVKAQDKDTYTITFMYCDLEPMVIKKGDALTNLPEPAMPKGATFSGWVCGNESIENGYVPTSDMNLYPTAVNSLDAPTPTSYIITFETGDFDPIDPIVVKAGDPIGELPVLNVPEKMGTFEAWLYNGKVVTKDYVPSSNMKLTYLCKIDTTTTPAPLPDETPITVIIPSTDETDETDKTDKTNETTTGTAVKVTITKPDSQTVTKQITMPTSEATTPSTPILKTQDIPVMTPSTIPVKLFVPARQVEGVKVTVHKKKLIITWDKVKGTKKYTVQISRDKNMKRGLKTYATSKTKKTLSVKKHTYWIRVKADDGKWSKIKKIKVK